MTEDDGALSPVIGSRSTLKHRLRTISAAMLIGVALVLAYGYSEATRNPVVRYARFVDRGLPESQRPLRILLMSDAHVASPSMTPRRLSRIVQQANALRPDVVVLGGDFLGDSDISTGMYSPQEAIEPLGALRATVGKFAVLGNHDREDTAATRQALDRAGIRLLENEAVQLGPVALGGFRTRYGSTLRRLLRLHGTRILIAHSPDAFADLPRSVPILLAGHTHCGQVVLPLIGALSTGSRFGSRYRCGLVSKRGRTLIVTAGLGTSRFPIRMGAPPDMWLITLSRR